MFDKVGLLSFPSGTDEDALMEAALDAGADDVIVNDDTAIDVITNADEFSGVKQSLDAAGFESESAEVTMRAQNHTSLDAEEAEKLLRLLDMLDELDDTQKIYSNADISEDVLAQIET
jgi:transcriptional/translational regulatory protein YebC/TACO1